MIVASSGFSRCVEIVGKSIEGVGIGVTALTVAGALVVFARAICGGRVEAAYRNVRRDVGQGVLLGLELLVAGDIVRTVAINPSLRTVAVLAGIVAIRTFLSFTIDTEINGGVPWRRGETGATSRAQTEADNARIARRWLTEGGGGALEVAEEVFATDFRTNGITVGTAGPKRNVTNRLTGFPDLRIIVEDQVCEGDRVASRVTWSGTHHGAYSGLPATGRHVEVMGITVMRFRAGKIVENWTVIDQFSLFQQLGAIPPTLGPAQVPADAHRETVSA